MFQTRVAYLARSANFQTEKAFDTDYPVDHVHGARKTNHEDDEQQVNISSIISIDDWDLNTHGFCIIKAETSLRCNDIFLDQEAYAQRDSRVQAHKTYWYEIEALLHEKFPCYSRIDGYDCTVIALFFAVVTQADQMD